MPTQTPITIAMVGDFTSPHFARWQFFLDRLNTKVIPISRHSLKSDPYPIHHYEPRIGVPFLRTFQRIKRVNHAVRQIQPDVVLGQYLIGPGWYTAVTTAPLKGVVVWGSDVSKLVRRRSFENLVNRWAARRLDFCVAISDFMKECLLGLGVPEEKIWRVNWPLYDHPTPVPPHEFEEFLAKNGLKKGKYLLSLRALSPVYNQETLIRSFHILQNQHPETRLVLLKYGIDSNYLSSLQDLITHLKLTDQVVFLEKQTPANFCQLCRNALVCVSISRSDGMPISVLEAMDWGGIVVAGRIPPVEELIDHNRNGLLVNLDNPEALAATLSQLIDDEYLRNRLITGAAQTIQKHKSSEYSMDTFVTRLSESLTLKS